MKNCFDCVFKDIVFTNLMSHAEQKTFDKSQYVMIEANRSHTGDYMGRCKRGFNEKFLAFHKEHGHLYRRNLEARTDLEMDCHKYSESVNRLDEIIDASNKLLEFLTNKKSLT